MMANSDKKSQKANHKSYGNYNKIGNLYYSGIKSSEQSLDILKPIDKGNGITLFYIHGGAYIYGSKDYEQVFCSYFVNRGFSVVSINYRYASLANGIFLKHQLTDVVQALNFIYENAAEYDISIDKLCLMGDSAGGHLALLLSILFNDEECREYFDITHLPNTNIRCLGLNSTMYDYVELARFAAKYLNKSALSTLFSPDYKNEEYLKMNSPSYYFSKHIQIPPIFNSSAANDVFKKQYKRLKEDADLFKFELTDIYEKSYKQQIGHVYNHLALDEIESIRCNDAMCEFYIKNCRD